MIDLKTREGRQKFYQTKEWQSIRILILQEQPWCVECLKEKLYSIATDVDHIVDIKVAPDLCLDITNLNPLCKSCHSKKTFKENKGKAFCKKAEWKVVNKKWNF